MATLWPDFGHFEKFANDSRLSGIRLNSAAIQKPELEKALELIKHLGPSVPLWYDVKGRQLRIEHVHYNDKYLDIVLNHPIRVRTPVPVLFKGGEDEALLLRLEEDGRRLIFQPGGPRWMVRSGDSIHIRDSSLKIGQPLFTDAELAKIEHAVNAGFKRYFLSYVGSQYEVDQFRELVGKDSEIYLKIEDLKGLEFVSRFKKEENIHLAAACGDLYVEVDRPHQIIPALKLIIEKDPEALVGSRVLLSIIKKTEIPGQKTVIGCNPVPSLADFLQIEWLIDKGYKTIMLCDELCLHEDLLSVGIAALNEVFHELHQ